MIHSIRRILSGGLITILCGGLAATFWAICAIPFGCIYLVAWLRDDKDALRKFREDYAK